MIILLGSPKCKMVKKLLDDKEIEYKYVNTLIEPVSLVKYYTDISKQRKIPQLFLEQDGEVKFLSRGIFSVELKKMFYDKSSIKK